MDRRKQLQQIKRLEFVTLVNGTMMECKLNLLVGCRRGTKGMEMIYIASQASETSGGKLHCL